MKQKVEESGMNLLRSLPGLTGLPGITAAIALAWAMPVHAQQLSLGGTVRDDVGVLQNVEVTLTAGGQSRTASTDNSGRYGFAGLSAGTAVLTFEMAGFSTETREATLGPNTPVVDVQLSVAPLATTLTVTDVAGRATATRLPVSDLDIPVQVNSVSRELLDERAANSMVDALQNVSGVQAFRWYGVYEYYTIRGFNQADAVLVDGMRFEGNRYGSQTNNVESVEVLKGPSSVMYGGRAVGGSINIVRKKPEGTPTYEVSYRGGRFNTHQVAGDMTGPLVQGRLLGRLGASYEHADGWRDAGSDRLNVSPSLTWLMGETARLTVYQTFNRDRFDGDGGVPFNIIGLPDFDPSVRFSLPQDNALVEDSQTQFLFNTNLAPNWEFRNSLLIQRTSDDYFVTEGIYGDPENNQVFREPLDFHHTRRPWQNQADVVGRFRLGSTLHTVALGYDYSEHDYRTDVTAGDDPDCVCGYWWLSIEPMNLATLEETNPPLDVDTIARVTSNENSVHSFFWQDQIELHPQVHVNIAGRYDDFTYHRERYFTADPGAISGIEDRNNDAYTYRAGIVYSPVPEQSVYFSTSSSFTPVFSIPPDGYQLDPKTGRNYEFGHRWRGIDGRVSTDVAFYHLVENNVNFSATPTSVVQVGEQRSRGIDVDVNAALGRGVRLILNYGYADPRFEEADDLGLTGKVPRFAQKHAVNAWIRKEWELGLNASIGMRYMGPQWINNTNTTRLGGFTVFSGAVGYATDRWEWSLNAANLFDRDRYFLPGHFSNLVFPGEPINVSSSIRVMF
jgi:iron complex outermembrane receptor protein